MTVVCLQGGNELTPPCRAMDEALLTRVAGGALVVVPLASKPGADYRRTGEHAVAYFRQLGAEAVVAPDARRAPDEAHAAVAEAGCIVLTGGSPRTLRDALVESHLDSAVRDRAAAGALVIGSSAGAMVACATTLLPQWRGNPETGPGIGLVADHVVVPHWDGKRSTWVRAAQTAGDVTVLGIPECSGVVVESTGDGHRLSAVGVEPTTVIRGGERSLLVAGVGFEPT